MSCKTVSRRYTGFRVSWIAVTAAVIALIPVCSATPLDDPSNSISSFQSSQSHNSGSPLIFRTPPQNEALGSGVRSRRLRDAAASGVPTSSTRPSETVSPDSTSLISRSSIEGVDVEARGKDATRDLADSAASEEDSAKDSDEPDSDEDEHTGCHGSRDGDHLNMSCPSGLHGAAVTEAADIEPAADHAAHTEADDDNDHILGSHIAYELPIQLRPRERGADPGYYQLMVDEQQYVDLLNSPSNASAVDSNQSARELEPKRNGAYMVCYVSSADELQEKFMAGIELGEGVYVPIQRMTEFGRHNDFTKGNPAIQDVQLSVKHYAAATEDWPQEFFSILRILKAETHLKVAGMWFGPPDYAEMDRILKENSGIFEGMYINWEDGEGACMNNFSRPPMTDAEGNPTYWAQEPNFFFRYFMGGQDEEACRLRDGRPYTGDTPVNVARELVLPDGVTPVFPCFGGYEGLCYKAFSTWIDVACDARLQLYSFAVYDRYSDRMRIMLEEGCKKIGRKVPPMDFVGAL